MTTPRARPAVLHIGTQHAREWLATEVTRRLLQYYVDNYGVDPVATELVDTRELWFVVVANPDGYQYTFDQERLWRKNLRDNDDDGEITNADGVDPNRNFPEHWNYDGDGSSSLQSSETYRGTRPASEPETRAMIRLTRRIDPTMVINYHTYGDLILYTFGWQVQTPTADDPIYYALSGTDRNPAIPGYDPGVGAELYITNGATTDYMHAERDALAWTVEISTGYGFVFPDALGDCRTCANWCVGRNRAILRISVHLLPNPNPKEMPVEEDRETTGEHEAVDEPSSDLQKLRDLDVPDAEGLDLDHAAAFNPHTGVDDNADDEGN